METDDRITARGKRLCETPDTSRKFVAPVAEWLATRKPRARLLQMRLLTKWAAAKLLFVAHSARLHYIFHGAVKVLTYSYLFYGGAAVVAFMGGSFRVILMKNPDFDSTYRRPDRENTWLGVVVV